MATNLPFDSRSPWRDAVWDVPLGHGAQPFSSRLFLDAVDERTSIFAGRAKDHDAVLALMERQSGKSRFTDFTSRLDEPGYEPSDRLLLLRDKVLAGHLHVSHRVGQFANVRTPLARFSELALEHDRLDEAAEEALFRFAETQAAKEGAVVAYAFADHPATFLRQGWSVWHGQGHTRANTRAALAHLEMQRAQRATRFTWNRSEPPLQVSTWRYFRLDDLRTLYEQSSSGGWGALYRSEETWRWLMGRGAHDLALVAHTTPPGAQGAQGALRAAEEASLSENELGQIVGYAILKDACLVEIAVDPQYEQARSLLLTAACREAIDRDRRQVALYTPAVDPLHELLVTAGGTWSPSLATSPGGCWMFKLLAPEKWIERMAHVWQARARDCGLTLPLHFDVATEEGRRHLAITRRSTRLQRCTSPGIRWIEGPIAAFHALWMGSLSLPEAQAQGRVKISDPETAETLRTIFPPQPLWQSPLEALRLN